jgi:putative membrane protein
MMGNYWGGGYGFMGGLFGPLFMIIFWVVIIWAIIAVVRAFTNGHPCGGHREHRGHEEDQAMKTLRDRYAKGEISKEQFEQMKKDLG